MRFTVHSQALSDGLAWISRSLPSRPTNAVLAGVKMDVADGSLTLSTFDYEQSTVATLEVAFDAEDGTVIVEGKKFTEFIKALPKGDVEVFVEGNRLRIRGGRAKFALPLMPVEDYPALPVIPAGFGTVPADLLADGVRRVSVAAARDDTVPMLTAMFVRVDPETGVLTFASTDRYRLAVKQVEFTPAPGAAAQSFLVPARSLDGYARALSGTDEVTLGGGTLGGSSFSLATGARTATGRLIDAEFAKFEKLLPDAAAVTATAAVPTKALAEVVKRVSLAADNTSPCRLAFDGTTVRVTTGPLDDPDGDETVSDVTYDGAPMTIAFAFGFLNDGLAAIGSDTVVFSLVAPLKPAVLRPATEDGVEADYTYLIMPVKIND